MEAARVSIAWLAIASVALPLPAQEMPYGVAKTPWYEGLGNHRARLRVTEMADAVQTHLPWRRHDLAPEKKLIIVVDAATGKPVTNVVPVNINREFGDVVFQPVTAPGEYFVYYMPFDLKREWGTVCNERYLPVKVTAEKRWLASLGLESREPAGEKWKVLPSAQLIEFQSRTEFDRFDPMEVIATAAEVEQLLKRHPGQPYLLFPEDRRCQIRMTDVLPQRWIISGPKAEFQGQAQPGEFYAFQIGLYAAQQDLQAVRVEFSLLRSKSGQVIPAGALRCINLGGTDWVGRRFAKTVNVGKGSIQALWCGVGVPPDAAPNVYTGTVAVSAKDMEARTVKLDISVAGETLTDCGDSDLQRLARLRWLDSTIGIDDEVTAPFTPVEVVDRTVKILGRELRFSTDGFPESIRSNGKEILASPMKMVVETAAGNSVWNRTEPKIVGKAPGKVAWEAHQTNGGLSTKCRAEMEYDGHIDFRFTIKAANPVEVKDVRLEIPVQRTIATYMMGLGRKGGYRPNRWQVKWGAQTPEHLWIGDVDAGLACQWKTPEDRWAGYGSNYLPMSTAWVNQGQGSVEVVEADADAVVVRARSGLLKFAAGQQREFRLALMITPVKPLNPAHWKWRYCDGWPGAFPLDKAVKLGVTVCNLHHSTPPNPFINYPFLALEKLSPYVETAHQSGIKVKLYYTVRLLSNHAAEMGAIRSLGSEILLDGPGGGRPWLQEHWLRNYSVGWYAPLEGGEFDCCLDQTGLSRWHNYYLEGLNWLIRNIGIDGVYLDGIGYDREVMKRVRKVMDRAKPGCLIDLHSGNEGPGCTANKYIEHFPYVDSLWFGEAFNYDETPDFWLVEISGIPFGLFGEMLGPDNPWRGMVYGMTGRYYHANRDDPQHIWRLWDEFGIQEARMTGYWDKSCPIKTDHQDVLATAYCKNGKVLVALASWSKALVQCHLKIDWGALRLDPHKSQLTARAITAFQAAARFAPSDPIPVPPGRGWLLLLHEEVKP